MSESEAIKFKFQFLDDNGNAQNFLSQKGLLTEESLTLRDDVIPIGAIIKVFQSSNRLVLAVNTEQDKAIAIPIQIVSGPIKKIHSALSAGASTHHVAARKAHLEEQGRGHEFRTEICPYCQASIDLSGFETTPQVYCPYCDAVATMVGDQPKSENKHQLCDQCGLYSMPQDYTEFYFYFLLVVYGWHYKTVRRCQSCMRKSVWMMFFGNLPFILGFPFAVIQLIRVYFGASNLSSDYAGLASANSLVQAGKYAKAQPLYEKILEKHPCSAGIRFNLGIAALNDVQTEQAAIYFAEALEDCSNYEPAAMALAECYKKLGRKDELKVLQALWSEPEETKPIEEAVAESDQAELVG